MGGYHANADASNIGINISPLIGPRVYFSSHQTCSNGPQAQAKAQAFIKYYVGS